MADEGGGVIENSDKGALALGDESPGIEGRAGVIPLAGGEGSGAIDGLDEIREKEAGVGAIFSPSEFDLRRLSIRAEKENGEMEIARIHLGREE